ncbi:hypothetical protein [Microbacterium abyssi]|uniref:hypothetical protein n=1 Tax=Microbacterium abyssi TaxID=2782166 RepID=UPI001887E4FE|nr:hypothetical protein [Microbacterium sp. A18JL241]
MQLQKLMRDLVDAVDGAGREFKTGFAGAFRKRGGKHRADADAIRRTDRRGRDSTPRHRAEPTTSHAKKYDILSDVTRGIQSHGHVPRHRDPDYSSARDLGHSVGDGIREIPRDIVDGVKGVPKNVPKQLVEELYEDAIGQDDPDKYGRQSGDMRFLAPASESADLSALSQGEIEVRFGLEPGALDGANVRIAPIPGSRFVSVEIDHPGRD